MIASTGQSDGSQLRRLLLQVSEQAALPPERALPLPSRMYWDPDVYEYELEHIFRKDWICVARVEQIPEVGDYLAVDLANEPIMIVRGEDSVLRAFSRVCRHRYVDLLGGKTTAEQKVHGCVERFECPYHSWTYRLDGSLMVAPEMSNRPDFDTKAYGLNAIRIEVWQGFVFVNLEPNASRPLDMKPIENLQDTYDFSKWKLAKVVDWGDSKVNWKMMVENYAECYHHVGIHKDSLQPLWPIGTIETGDEYGAEWTYSRMMAGPEDAAGELEGHLLQPTWLPPQRDVSPYLRSQSLLITKFPIFMIVPSPDVTFWFKAMPRGPEYHNLQVGLLVPEEHFTADGFEEKVNEIASFFLKFQAEDASINENIQSAARSARASGGVLQELEQSLWQLQKYLAKNLPIPE